MTQRGEIVNNIGYKITRAALEYVEKHEFADAIDAFEAGADVVVIGNYFEQNPEEIKEFVRVKRENYGE